MWCVTDTAPECSREWEHLRPQRPSPFQLSRGPRVHDGPALEMLTVTHPMPTPQLLARASLCQTFHHLSLKARARQFVLAFSKHCKTQFGRIIKDEVGTVMAQSPPNLWGSLCGLWPTTKSVSGTGVNLNENFPRLKGATAPGHAPLWGGPRVGRFCCLCPALAV